VPSDWWRLRLQKLRPDLSAAWGPDGVTLTECPQDMGQARYKGMFDALEGISADPAGGVFVAWSTGPGSFDSLWVAHVTADGQLDWSEEQ